MWAGGGRQAFRPASPTPATGSIAANRRELLKSRFLSMEGRASEMVIWVVQVDGKCLVESLFSIKRAILT